MLRNVSWTNYITTIVIGMAIYYLFVAIRYYADEIKDILSGRKKLNFKPALPESALPEMQPMQSEDAPFEEIPENNFDEVEQLIKQLKTAIADGSSRKLIPDEFKMNLIMVLRQYPDVKYSPLRPSINELILSECEKSQAATMDIGDVELLWREGL